MGLRVKFAIIFLVLLIVPVSVVSAIEIDRRMAVMVDDLADSGSLIINQAFEQIRSLLASAPDDPAAVLEGPKRGRSVPKVLTIAEVDKLLAQAQNAAADAKQFSVLLPIYEQNKGLFERQLLVQNIAEVMTNAEDKWFVPSSGNGKQSVMWLMLNREPVVPSTNAATQP